VTVWLLPGREWLARQLDATTGSKLAIFIGLTTWDGRPGQPDVRGPAGSHGTAERPAAFPSA
jgi:hypothetical protein